MVLVPSDGEMSNEVVAMSISTKEHREAILVYGSDQKCGHRGLLREKVFDRGKPAPARPVENKRQYGAGGPSTRVKSIESPSLQLRPP